jgi:hypothetical protein
MESLLSAVVADGMTGRKHDPDAELLGQGLGNLVAPFFGGFAATGAIARTATNVRSGARTPVAAVVHCLFVLLALLVLAPLLGHLPMASLAALLLVVAWNMSERRHFGKVILAGVQPQPMRALAKAGWRNRQGRLRIFRSFERAIADARAFAARSAMDRHAAASSPARID